MIVPVESPAASFRHLTDNKFIICISKNPTEAEIQATFNHSVQRKSFTQKDQACFALTGFGSRDTPVKLDPKEIFKQTRSLKKLRKFPHLIQCKKEEEVAALEATDTRKVGNYAILPPFLSEVLFEDDDQVPMNVLLNMLAKARTLIKKREEIVIDDESKEKDEGKDNDDHGDAKM